MYIVFGNEIMDSSEVADIIEGNSNFTVEKDLTKGSKREDTLAYQISISIEELNEILKDNQKPDKQKFDESIRVAPGIVDERKAINQVRDMIEANDKIQEDFDYTN